MTMPTDSPAELPQPLLLADWRRRIASLYDAVRQAPKPEAAWRDWCATRAALFRDHPQSPLTPEDRALFGGIPVYDYDPFWRFTVKTVALEDHPSFTVDLGKDGLLHLTPCARTVGLDAAIRCELTLYRLGGYGGGLFLPFRDGTAGNTTYGGGRYLLDTIKGADLGTERGRLVLDFNFAFHPSCHHAPRWTCPLAPPENCFATPVEAGERLPVSA